MTKPIFLSYASLDVSWVEEFAIALEQEGVEAWFSYNNIRAGEDARERIQEELRKSQVVIVFISRASVRNPYIFFELGAAVADNKQILTVVIDDIPPGDMPLPLIKYQYLKAKSPVDAARQIATIVRTEDTKV